MVPQAALDVLLASAVVQPPILIELLKECGEQSLGLFEADKVRVN